MTVTWKYAAGEELVAGFKKSFVAGGGEVLKDITLPFPDVEFQSILAEIGSLKPDAVYSFFAGGGALKFIKDYAGAKLNEKIPLWGPGFLTDGVEKAAGPAGDGVKTALHYVESARQSREQEVLGGFHGRLQVGAGRLRRAGLGRHAAAARRPRGGRRRRQEAAGNVRGHGKGLVQEPARSVQARDIA